MKSIFTFGDYQLYTPLGQWHKTIPWTSTWDWFVSSSHEFLYEHNKEGVWKLHLRISNKHHAYCKECLTTQEESNCPLMRASIGKDGNCVRMLNKSN